MAQVYLCRIESFSAAHRLHSPHLSDIENAQLYGKCNHIHGHGHNYKVEVVLKGKVTDPSTGMVMNISLLKEYMKQGILDLLDHKHIDKDVEYFHTQPSTAENIAIFIWKTLKNIMPSEHARLLYQVKVFETDKNIVWYQGEEYTQ